MTFGKPNFKKEICFLAYLALQRLKHRGEGKTSTQAELTKDLKLDKGSEALLKEALELLEARLLIVKKRKRWGFSKDLPSEVEGTIHTHPRGFGFVALPGNIWGEVFIPKGRMNRAAQGDTVVVEVDYTSSMHKGPEGRILKVVSRSREMVVGTVLEILPKGMALAFAPLLSAKILVRRAKNISVGDRIRVRVKNWGEQGNDLEGTLEETLGSIYNPSDDVKLAILENELTDGFSQEVLREVKTFSTRVTPKEIKGRYDYRNDLTITIDPKTAKDFDDALTFHEKKNGDKVLVVHIADVSHYVQKDSEIDKEAFLRGNSTYFPMYCVPMLPHELSNHLCSLKPRVNRLTVSVEMHFDTLGELQSTKIHKGVIHSDKRYTYEQAQAILEGRRKDPHATTIRKMAAFSALLRKKREMRGAVNLTVQEIMIEIDEKGNPIKPCIVEHDESHKLVEEFMLKANEVVAEHLVTKEIPGLYRIHEAPSDDNVKEFVQVLKTLGIRVNRRIDGPFLNKLFQELEGKSILPFLVGAYIRSMRLAVYDPEPKGHFGLQLENYSHFTSPIRRYADLVVHRALFGETLEEDDLVIAAKHCSDRERVSSRAEGSVILLKKLRLLQEYFTEDPERLYDVLVTKVLPFGIVVSLEGIGVDGMIHVNEFSDDYYIYDEKRAALIGRHTNKTFMIGSSAKVFVKDVNLINLEVQWGLKQKERTHSKKKDRRKEARKRDRFRKKKR